MSKAKANRDADWFFKTFKQLPEYYKLEKVHQLINNPTAKATLRVKSKFKPFKFIIMSTFLAIGLLGVLFFNNPPVELTPNTPKEYNNVMVYDKQASLEIHEAKLEEVKLHKQVKISTELYKEEKKKSVTINVSSNKRSAEPSKIISDCNWPLDTVLARENMYVYLNNEELLALGIHVYENALIYRNRLPGSKEVNGLNLNQNFAPEPPITYSFTFSGIYITDTNCTTFRWGHQFYEEVDTLMPVFVDVPCMGMQIFWFNVNDDLFNVLPERYQHLKPAFENLLCSKKKNPNHTFVNYVNVYDNVVLDEINYLELSFEEFGRIGVDISEGKMNIKHPTSQLWYCINNKAITQTTWGPFPPNPLPLLVTDEKGLEQNFFGWRDSIPFEGSFFDVLVPVKMPLNEIFSDKDYFEIFWFYPTKDFIDSLPDRYREHLRLEYLSLIGEITDEEPSECIFFEACKSTLLVDDLKVYPNPVQHQINIEFELDREMMGSISIANVSGQLIQEFVSKEHFESGLNKFSFHLDNVPKGIYLLFIKTSEGFKTQRIIVSD